LRSGVGAVIALDNFTFLFGADLLRHSFIRAGYNLLPTAKLPWVALWWIRRRDGWADRQDGWTDGRMDGWDHRLSLRFMARCSIEARHTDRVKFTLPI
jgi:hypothetical protein